MEEISNKNRQLVHPKLRVYADLLRQGKTRELAEMCRKEIDRAKQMRPTPKRSPEPNYYWLDY